MRNVVIISSEYTGHGHKSIGEALSEQFNLYDDVNVKIIDGFGLAGNMWVKFSKSYGIVTRNAKDLWKLAWKLAERNSAIINEFTELNIRESFIEMINELKPDIIISIHPLFNTPIINILRDYNLKIPFITFIADLVSISPLWVDNRADCIICPTQEAKQRCLNLGAYEKSLQVIGFPVRSKFLAHINNGTPKNLYHMDRPLECLIMSGAEGSGNMNTVSRILLDNFNCNVRIIAGRNVALKERLEKSLSAEYPGRVDILGFVSNIQDYMLGADIAFTRGSPNVMMEAVACNVPLVITGALPGQEKENPNFAVNNSLGVFCDDVSCLSDTVAHLLSDNAKALNEILKAQQQYFDHNTAKNIVEHSLSLINDEEVFYPSEYIRKRKFLSLKLQFRKSS